MNAPIRVADLKDGGPKVDLCFFISSMQGGGAEKVLIDLTRSMLRSGLIIDILVMRYEGALKDEVPSGIRLVALDGAETHWAWGGWCVSYLRYLRHAKPERVVANLENGCLASLLLQRISKHRHKLFLRIDGNLFWHRAGRPFSRRPVDLLKFGLARLLYRRAERVICVSEGLRRRIEASLRLNEKQSVTIYNPLGLIPQIAIETRRSGTEYRLLAVGRLVREKDFANLLRAFSLVRTERTCSLTILGEGELRRSLERLVRELGLEGSVCLPGYVKNVDGYMRDSHMFVLSSRSEGLPTVLIEALIHRMLIVSTDCEFGPNEILAGGEFGTLVPVGDVTLLAKGILDRMRSQTSISESALSAHLNQFSVEHVTNRYLCVLGLALAQDLSRF